MENILAAVVTGALSLAGVIISNMMAAKRTEHQISLNQAVMDTKLQNLTDEVRSHNNFAVQIPVIREQIKVINHRLEDLENRQ